MNKCKICDDSACLARNLIDNCSDVISITKQELLEMCDGICAPAYTEMLDSPITTNWTTQKWYSAGILALRQAIMLKDTGEIRV